ncbi:MAG TPA: hypothetical protein VGJ89_00685 [Geothrix sp.]|jgi:hypothetical protein
MLHTRTIRDLDEMRILAFPPPYALVDALEAAEGRSEDWSVLMAFEQGSSHAQWVAVFPEAEEARFYTEDDQLVGRWDPHREIFIPDEGSPLDLRGRPVSLASIEEDEEEEDAEAEERRQR